MEGWKIEGKMENICESKIKKSEINQAMSQRSTKWTYHSFGVWSVLVRWWTDEKDGKHPRGKKRNRFVSERARKWNHSFPSLRLPCSIPKIDDSFCGLAG
jgi:hypothetical protein